MVFFWFRKNNVIKYVLGLICLKFDRVNFELFKIYGVKNILI